MTRPDKMIDQMFTPSHLAFLGDIRHKARMATLATMTQRAQEITLRYSSEGVLASIAPNMLGQWATDFIGMLRDYWPFYAAYRPRITEEYTSPPPPEGCCFYLRTMGGIGLLKTPEGNEHFLTRYAPHILAQLERYALRWVWTRGDANYTPPAQGQNRLQVSIEKQADMYAALWPFPLFFCRCWPMPLPTEYPPDSDPVLYKIYDRQMGEYPLGAREAVARLVEYTRLVEAREVAIDGLGP